MKNYLKVPLIGLLLSMIIYSCNNEATEYQVDLQDVANQINAEYFIENNITIAATTDEIIISSPSGRNFFLQVESPSTIDFEQIGKCELIKTEKMVFINSLETDFSMILSLQDVSLDEKNSFLEKINQNAPIYYGYGIVETILIEPITQDLPDIISNYSSIYDFFEKDLTQEERHANAVWCDSGGCGATSCSTTNNYGSCSVSTAGGYYACCNDATSIKSATCKPVSSSKCP